MSPWRDLVLLWIKGAAKFEIIKSVPKNIQLSTDQSYQSPCSRVTCSTLKSLRGSWKSIALAEWGSISTEAEGKCLCHSLIGNALGECQFVVDTALLWSYIQPRFGGHFMNILSRAAGKTPSQFWRRLLLGRLLHSSEEGFCWQVTQCAITGLGFHSQRSLQTCLLVMVQESIPSCCIFPYLSSIQSLSRVQLFATPWTAGH